VGRRLGQHFLHNREILERIAGAACPDREPLVIEIGAGKGALTKHLLPRADRVVAIETDPALVEFLGQRFPESTGLTLIRGDVLKSDLTQWGPAVVTGNLPYYITSPILAKVLALGPRLRRAVFLVQREVAQRLTASPGTRDYGFLTVRTRLFATPEVLFTVKPGAFRPPPKVESAVIRLEPRGSESRPEVDDLDRFLDFVLQCFRQKRKTIRNNLAGDWPRDVLDSIPETGRRAEELTLEEFVSLYRNVGVTVPPFEAISRSRRRPPPASPR
jgi:16S rRNA (adenine1518-N6/adenine1519-N6)-dimethyltransferase